MRIFVFFIFFAMNVVSAKAQPTLQTLLIQGKEGDYIVTEMGKQITLIHLHTIRDPFLILEEISIPKRKGETLPSSWKDWVKQRAPHHSSWSMTLIDYKTGKLLESYSFSNHNFIQLDGKENLFASLLQAPLTLVSNEERKKIGPPPEHGEPDFRKLWQPSLVFEGQKITSPHFQVFQTIWPQDGSTLQGQEVVLYFDQELHSALPYWIEIKTSHIYGQLRVIDSGKGLKSPHRSVPKRAPQFIGKPSGAFLKLKCPCYYQDLSLFAVDQTDETRRILPISYKVVERTGEKMTLQVDEEEFNELQMEHIYHWMAIPSEGMHTNTATSLPFRKK